MRKLIFTLTVLISALLLEAQEAVQEMVTDRPDQTESSAIVPLNSLQIETGFVMENNETDYFETTGYSYNTTLLRYGLIKNMELRIGLEYLGQETKVIDSDSSMTVEGLSPMYAGFKVQIAEENGLLPEVAYLGALVLPFTAVEDFKPSNTAANMRFAFAHTLSDRLSLGYNLGAEWDGDSPVPSYFYSVALGAGITDKLGGFVETYGLIGEEGGEQHLADAGFTYLVAPNFQFDLSGGVGLNDDAIDNFISFGFSWRIPQ